MDAEILHPLSDSAASRMVPQTLSKRNIDDILTMMLFVICAPRHYIQNPHIIAKAVEVIHWLCARSEHTLLRQPTEYLFNHRLAQDSLVRALTKLYAGTAMQIIDRGVSLIRASRCRDNGRGNGVLRQVQHSLSHQHHLQIRLAEAVVSALVSDDCQVIERQMLTDQYLSRTSLETKKNSFDS